jgi:hypothetical protein
MANPEVIARIARLLWQQQSNDALELLLATRDGSSRKIASLQNELATEKAFLAQLEALLPPEDTVTGGRSGFQAIRGLLNFNQPFYEERDDPLDKVTAAQKELRRGAVIQTAKALTPTVGDTITVAHLANVLDQVSVEMWVPSNRIATTIANILSRTEFFEHASPGTYKRIRI